MAEEESLDNNNEQLQFSHSLNSPNDIESNEQIVIDHKQEALKGNFSPACILLERREIDVNEKIDTYGNTLLHLATQFRFLNVIRTLIELFQADVNAKNDVDQTAFHILCKNTEPELFTVGYFLKCESIDLDIEDSLGYTALTYSIINHLNSLFFALVDKQCDLHHKDNIGNGLLYHAIKNDNVIVMKYLLYHNNESLNDFNGKKLSDVLIESKDSKCCKFLLKYYFIRILYH